MKTIAVSGCLGFIGRYVTDRLLTRGDMVYGIDAMTQVADPRLLDIWAPYLDCQQLKFVVRDINDLGTFPDIQAIINLAAETHVDNSITDNSRFVRSNVLGVQHLLEMCRAMRQYEIPTFVQISTDEVYGSIGTGETTEGSPLAPSSPYAASKAAADLLVQGWGHTYGVPWRIVRPSNCYGQGQYPEKLIPKAVRMLMQERMIPIHEGGKAQRYWLNVKDCAEAILTILDLGTNNQIYNIGGNQEASVQEVASAVVRAYHGPEADPSRYLDFGYTRLGLDTRYHVNDAKLRSLGWEPKGNLMQDIPVLVRQERAILRW